MRNYKGFQVKERIGVNEVGFSVVIMLCFIPFVMGICVYDSDELKYLIGYMIALLMIIMVILSLLGLK
jgi:hypothetical protein